MSKRTRKRNSEKKNASAIGESSAATETAGTAASEQAVAADSGTNAVENREVAGERETQLPIEAATMSSAGTEAAPDSVDEPAPNPLLETSPDGGQEFTPEAEDVTPEATAVAPGGEAESTVTETDATPVFEAEPASFNEDGDETANDAPVEEAVDALAESLDDLADESAAVAVDASSGEESDSAVAAPEGSDEVPFIEASAVVEEAGGVETAASPVAAADESESGEEEPEVIIHDADAEDAAEKLARLRESMKATEEDGVLDADEIAPGGAAREMAELMSIIEALIFVSEEPISPKSLAEILNEDRGWVTVACEALAKEFNERNSGLMLREVAGGWQIATRPEYHEHIRSYLKSRPSAKLSIAALETLAVIAYKQPITIPEILEIRGVQSSSAIKTLLDKRLIVTKGRKEAVGRPMMYGTSKEFLMQFGLRDLSELPSIEDFEDLASGGA